LFGSTEIPALIGAPCCAQFAVSREQIRKRPKKEYIRYRQWVLGTELSDAKSGRVMEFLWHVIFGQNAVQYVLSELGWVSMLTLNKVVQMRRPAIARYMDVVRFGHGVMDTWLGTEFGVTLSHEMIPLHGEFLHEMLPLIAGNVLLPRVWKEGFMIPIR